ncbi:hypothetical protein Tco_0039389 [Tanacetum coccineum]
MNQAAIDRLVAERVNAAVEAGREGKQMLGDKETLEWGKVWGSKLSRKCTFSGIHEMQHTVFHGHDGSSRKVKFAAATLQGRALTWWKLPVGNDGLEAANQDWLD